MNVRLSQDQKIKEELIKEQAKLEIAGKMKSDGIDIDTIKKYTGLTKWDIRKL